ncbi:MAG: dTMP kinase [Nocardioidaceae bacterium]
MSHYAPRGCFIAFEGGEGAGKSTQARLLGEWLAGKGYDVVQTREPGGTEVGREIRGIVLDPETGELSHRTEALLYAADKAEHVDTVVLPALGRGAIVITDRYVDSTLAYQGAGRGLSPGMEDGTRGGLEQVARWATRDLRPHLTVLLDVDPDHGMARFTERDRIESEGEPFHRVVRQMFLDLAAADPVHYLVLDGSASVDVIFGAVRTAVEPLLGQVER